MQMGSTNMTVPTCLKRTDRGQPAGMQAGCKAPHKCRNWSRRHTEAWNDRVPPQHGGSMEHSSNAEDVSPTRPSLVCHSSRLPLSPSFISDQQL